MGSAQVLLTHADLADRERYLNARSTLRHAARPERRAGDQRERHRRQRRDQVRRQRHAGRAGRQPARCRRARHPHRPEGPVLAPIRARIRRRASSRAAPPATPRSSAWPAAPARRIGRGGMMTKILAAKRAARSGASTVIAWGREPDVPAAPGRRRERSAPRSSRRRRRSARASAGWRPPAAARRGRRSTKARPPSCATEARACCRSACVSVEGDFHRGDVIAVRDAGGERDRRAASANYAQRRGAADRAQALVARSSRLLGYAGEPELIHRDNLVLA